VLLLALDVPPPSAEDVPASPLARAAVRLALAALRLVPDRARTRLAEALGRLAFAVGIRRRVTLDNLAAAFPGWSAAERRAVARRTYANMARAALEAALGAGTPPTAVSASVVSDEAAAVDRALAAGRGALVVTAHLGSWELFGAEMARRGVQLHAVVRPLSGAFNAEVVAARVRSGLRLIHTRGALPATLAALRRNEVVTVLLDQAVGGRHALFVPFFGRPAATTPLVSVAARRSGAPVFLGLAPREQGKLRVRVEGPFPVPSTGNRSRDLWAHTATLTAALERAIREYPDQWLWLHRRWKVPPGAAPGVTGALPQR
jgi:Kdo2-lipid IVA lauroyltransferase/acyltransferase